MQIQEALERNGQEKQENTENSRKANQKGKAAEKLIKL